MLEDSGELLFDVVEQPVELSVDSGPVGLVIEFRTAIRAVRSLLDDVDPASPVASWVHDHLDQLLSDPEATQAAGMVSSWVRAIAATGQLLVALPETAVEQPPGHGRFANAPARRAIGFQ